MSDQTGFKRSETEDDRYWQRGAHSQRTMSSISRRPVTLRTDAAQLLQEWAHDIAATKDVPGVMLGATSADAELFWLQAGDRVFGHPDKGQLHAETSG